jgi:hypothetical protein
VADILRSVPREVWGIVIAVITWLSAKGVAKLSRKAQDFKTRTDGTINAGQLVLNAANRADGRLDKVEKRLEGFEQWYRRLVYVWWPEHVKHDAKVKGELLKLDPSAEIPDPPLLPELRLEGDDED